MIVESVELKDYRNYEFLDMNFNEHVNIIYGDNAQGKTNILESIYMCSTSKSHRGSKDREIIRFGEDESHIKLNVLKHGMKYRIDMHLKKNKTKGIAVNGIPIKKAVELCKNLGYNNLYLLNTKTRRKNPLLTRGECAYNKHMDFASQNKED